MYAVPQQRKKHNWWKYLLTFLGGMIFALGGTALGLYIYGSNTKMKSFFGADVDLYLTPEYQNKSVLDMLAGLINGDFNFQNLGDLAKVTPYINSQLETINDTLEENFKYRLNVDEMQTIPFGDLEEYIGTSLREGITLAGVLSVNETSDSLLKYLCFEMNGDEFDFSKPYTLSQYMSEDSNFFSDLINNMKVGYAVNEIDEDNYVMQAIKDYTIAELNDANVINSIKISSFFSDEQLADSKLLEAIKDWPIGDLGDADRLKTLKIGDIFDLEPAPGEPAPEGSVLYALRNYTIGQLEDDENVLDSLKLKDLMKITDETPQFVKSLQDKTIGELKKDDIVGELYIQDVMDPDESDFIKALSELHHYCVVPANEEEHPLHILSTPTVKAIYDDPQAFDPHDGTALAYPYLSADAVAKMDTLEKDVYDGDYYLYGRLSNTKYDLDTNTWTGLLDYKIEVRNFINQSGRAVDPIDGEFDDLYVVIKGCFKRTEGTRIREISDSINLVKLNQAIKITGDSPVLDALQDKVIGELSNAIENLTVDQVVKYDDFNDLPPVLQTLINNGTKVNELKDAINDLVLKDVIKIPEGSALEKVQNCGLDGDEIIAAIKTNLVLKDVMDITSTDKPILQNLADTPLDQIADTISTMSLKQMMTIDTSSPKILQYLQDYTFDDLNDSSIMDNMKISDVLTDDQINSSRFISLLPNTTTIINIGSAIEDLKIVDVFENEIYGKNSDNSINKLEVKNLWKYLLLESGETLNMTSTTDRLEGLKCRGDGTPTNPGYTIGHDIEKLTNNMKNNIANATLNSLVSDGIIGLNSSDATFLTRVIILPPTNPYYATWNGHTYGELTIEQFIQIVNSLV